MNLIFQSISKIVFLMIALTACVTFAAGILTVDKFMELAVMAFSFFFSIKGPGGTSDDVCDVKGPDKKEIPDVPFVQKVTKQAE